MELDLDGLQLLPGEEAQLYISPEDERCTYTCDQSCKQTCLITN